VFRATLANERAAPAKRAQAEVQLAELEAREPPRDTACFMCVRAWFDLGTERSIGMAVGPIPWSRIVQWCRFYGLDRDATGLVIHVVRQLDNDHAAADAATRSKEKATGKGKRT
jgi:hypothetical protein